MSTIIYEQVMDALLLLLKTKCGNTFSYYSRRFGTWENILQQNQQGLSIQQPALFLYDGIGFGGGIILYEQRGRGTPQRRTMKRTIVVYALTPDGRAAGGIDATTPGGSVFAPLQQSIEDALAAEIGDAPGGALTLGGLCSHCWIDGDIHWLTGDIDPDGQGMFTLPINIMLP